MLVVVVEVVQWRTQEMIGVDVDSVGCGDRSGTVGGIRDYWS